MMWRCPYVKSGGVYCVYAGEAPKKCGQCVICPDKLKTGLDRFV
jgi:hypothetical protein